MALAVLNKRAKVTEMNIDAETIEAALRQLMELPTPVSSWQVETGSDSTDDPAVWVWAILKDDDVEFKKRSQLRSIIRDRVQKETGSSMLVYVRFRGASEMSRET
ncbi:MAG: hypothetical protein ERJ67_07700 [Aphanocapsa feldmannii 277cV]|uniref:Uncharacterized protein n=1 Tax=Aphanocapsa feldmannii 277cV TaxID=2507553 RepID=A0A524RME2_9CHRO|nr:MAG: hypothetical protein ERJ67_07700 [Aphanocapsa feldmannii 277cV]